MPVTLAQRERLVYSASTVAPGTALITIDNVFNFSAFKRYLIQFKALLPSAVAPILFRGRTSVPADFAANAHDAMGSQVDESGVLSGTVTANTTDATLDATSVSNLGIGMSGTIELFSDGSHAYGEYRVTWESGVGNSRLQSGMLHLVGALAGFKLGKSGAGTVTLAQIDIWGKR